MKTLEHEIRDVLNRVQLDERKKSSKPVKKDNSSSTSSSDTALDIASLAPGPVGIAASAEIARREAVKGNYLDAALAGLGVIPVAGRFTSGARVGTKAAKYLKNRRIKAAKRRRKAAKRRRGAAGLAAGAAAAAAGGGGGADGATNGHKDVDHSTIIQSHGPRGKTTKIMVDSVIVESREDIEATPRFTETDRKKIDVVPRAENDLETANRKRFRLENIKKKIIDESLNIRHEFNNFLIEENIELTEEEYDEAFDILFQYFVQDLNENTVSNIYKGAKKTLGFVGKKVLAPALYASDAYEKYKKGDTSGALTSGAKAVASANPYGAAASIAHDAYEARKEIAGAAASVTDIAKRGYNYVRKSLLGKPKPSNQISQKKRKPIGLQRTSVT